MGWAFGTNAQGREVGYGVKATCDQPGCDVEIDRGLGYVCGDMHDGGEFGCGCYFCAKHLSSFGPELDEDCDEEDALYDAHPEYFPQLCLSCELGFVNTVRPLVEAWRESRGS